MKTVLLFVAYLFFLASGIVLANGDKLTAICLALYGIAWTMFAGLTGRSKTPSTT